MPVFEYTGLNAKGKKASGIIDAESALAARHKLRSSSIFPTAISEVHSTAAVKENHRRFKSAMLGRVKAAEVTMMTRQLATLMGAGFPLVPAIDSLVPQTRSSALKKNMAKIKDSVVEGNSLAQALSLFPGTFSDLYVNMVRAGETSGTLEIVLGRLADIMESQQELKTKITSALAYPILMSIFGAGVLFFLMAHIVPTITAIFAEMNQVLPAPTRFLIRLSAFIQGYGWALLVLLAAVLGLYFFIAKTDKGRHLLDKLKLRLPVLGALLKKLAVARFTRTLGSLLENGVSMLTALKIVKDIAGNTLIGDAIERATEDVSKGQPLAGSLEKQQIFPGLSIQMIHVGEQSGALENMLYKIAQVYESEVESRILRMTALLEPVMIMVMGVVVGFIVLSIVLPIFEMNQLVM